MIKLEGASLKHKAQALAFIEEVSAVDKEISGDGNLSNHEIYEEWLKFEHSIQTQDIMNQVHSATKTFFSVANNQIIGVVHCRLELSAFLENSLGHIGYSVRPKYRQKGYGKQQLKLALDLFRSWGYNRVMIVCNPENAASRNTILSQGGQFERIVVYKNELVEQYWVML